MKIHSVLAIAVLALFVASTPFHHARARGADWPGHALKTVDDLGFLAVSGAYEEIKRDVHDGSHRNAILRGRDAYGQLSVDLLDFLSLMAGVGYVQVKPQKYFDYEDGGSLWMMGAKATFWEHIIKDPVFLANRLRFDTALSYWEYDSEYFEYPLTWDELRGSLTFSAEAFVENWGQDLGISPYSIVFTAGVVYSNIDGQSETPMSGFGGVEGGSTGFVEAQPWGGLFAIDIYVAHNLSISGEARMYANTTYTLGASFHF